MADKRCEFYLKCIYTEGLAGSDFFIYYKSPENNSGKAELAGGGEFPPRGMDVCNVPKKSVIRQKGNEGLVSVGIMSVPDEYVLARIVDLDRGGLCNIRIPVSELVVKVNEEFCSFEEVRENIKFVA